METRLILDSQITSSSAKSEENGDCKSRLNSANGWIAAIYDENPWLQVDFIANVTITSIISQGLNGSTSRVTKFTLVHGYDRMNLKNYTENGSAKVRIGQIPIFTVGLPVS